MLYIVGRDRNKFFIIFGILFANPLQCTTEGHQQTHCSPARRCSAGLCSHRLNFFLALGALSLVKGNA